MRRFAPDGPPAGAAARPAGPALGDGNPGAREAPPRRDTSRPGPGPLPSVGLGRLVRFFVEPPTERAPDRGRRPLVDGVAGGEPSPPGEPPPGEPPPGQPPPGQPPAGDLPPGESPLAVAAVAPLDGAPDVVMPATLSAPRVVVLGSPADTAAVARAVALRLAATDRRAAGVLATWSAHPAADDRLARSGPRAPVRPAAAALAEALEAGGHAARCAGRLVHVRLGAEPGAVAEAERVQDLAGRAPVVLALGGGRGPEWDRLLAHQQLVLLAVGPAVPPALAAVALAGTRDLCGATPALTVAVGAGRRPRVSREQLTAALGRVAAR